MKRKGIRRLTTVFLSLFLVCICLGTVFAFPVSAAAASNNDYVYKTDYTTKDKKPTYTATLNENNRLLKELNKKENKVLNKVKSEGKDWVNDAFSLANAIKNSSGEDVDWEKVGVEATKNIITSIAGIWGFDGIAGAVLEGIESLTSSGEAPLSEVQVLSDDIDQRFNEISDQLYDIEEQLGALSNQVTASANDVLSGTQAQIDNLNAKQILRSFMSSGEGNFSYLEFSNYLYGNDSSYVNASEAYYILLIEAIQSGASDDVIEYYYNKLFESIYTNIAIYNQYYYGDVAGLDKSMAAYYYDYLSYNPNLVDDGTSAEYQALLFALDLYTTYVYSYEILEMCFAYQVTNMYLDASLENRDISDIDTYEYADGKLITYSTIQAKLADMQAYLVLAEEQIAEDIAYILGMKDSYIAVDENGDIHSIGNYGESFGNIADGQVIYLNVIPDEICELFVLDTDSFKYYVNGTEYIGATKGVVDSDDVYSDTITASVKYGNAELYSIEFTKIDNTSIEEFSGGSGTADDPYLISNATQFYMVADDLDACYQLISNITVTGTHSPIGTEKKPFNGTFDGNGYSITNLVVESLAYDSTNITMTPTTGMFGTISRTGVVKNLTLNALQIVSDHENDSIYPENDISYYCIGGIAGTNRGTISNCTIINNSSITVNRLKQTQDSRTVEIYIGGIAGNNVGTIEYCSTDGLSITADSYLYYYNESTSKNQHSLYVGGIAAVTSNKIQYCRVSENSMISAYAKSIADSEDREKPILTIYVGGIIADDSAKQYISNVYSNCTIVKCKGEIYNEGTYWGEHRYSWDKVSLKQGLYYPTFFPLSDTETVDDFEMKFYSSEYLTIYNKNYAVKYNEVYSKYDRGLTAQELQEVALTSSKELKAKLLEDQSKANSDALTALSGKIVSNYDDASFIHDDGKLNVSIELTDNVCDINATYLTEYFNKLIDEDNEIKNIKFVDENGETVEATVVGYYGFYTYHESSESQLVTVKVFFYVDDVLLSDDVTLSIKAKELVSWEIKDFVDTSFEKGSSTDTCLDTIFEHGFRIIYTYSNGQTEEYIVNTDNKDTVDIYNLVTSKYGEKTITIYHNEQPNVGKLLKFEQTIDFACNHTNDKFQLIDTVAADCEMLGYEVWKCSKCGEEIHKNYVKGDHTYVVTDGQAATCHEAGYTQEVSCSVCNKTFVASEWIQALPHNYVSGSDEGFVVDASYPASDYHYCTNGNHYEAHQYTVKEYVDDNGALVYLYTCSCGYENPVPDYNIKTKENGEKPVVIITDGYVLNVGDEVVVYVQILNNPGFKGATFGIRYDDGLELISVDESTIVPQQLKVRNEVYNGYNFLWATGDGNITTEDGYLLKLTFRYVSEDESEQHISVVYGMNNGSEGGFCTLDDECHKFMTQTGTVSVVDHLPGDVNNDNVVDIMDATYIAWSIVGKKDEQGNAIQVNAKYADVNLDGSVDLLDVIAILQSISGRYGTNLLSSDYKLFFNLNGFICDEADESIMVEFYDENGSRNTWSENVDFEKYKALMNQLGYTFVGWYTRMDCTCEESECTHCVKADSSIAYDKYQGNQTLYARWEKNKISFNMGGSNCDQFEEILYSKDEHENESVTLDQPTWSYDIDYIVDGSYYDDGRIYKDFLGWRDEDGNWVTEIDLSQANIGTINLTAVWSEYKWITPDKTEDGYYNIEDWFVDAYYKNGIDEINANDVVASIVNAGCKIYGQRNPIKYTITYNDTRNMVNGNDTEYIVTDTITLSDLSDYTGYEFDCWVDENGNPITSIKGTTYNRVITAKWKAKVYTITVESIDIDSSKQNDSEGNPKYDSISIGTIYYTYGDENHAQGFYKDVALATKLPSDYFADYCVNAEGKTNFIFSGLFSSSITNNGHSYASYASNTCVLSADGSLDSNPILSEESKAGTVYALFLPNLYTITLDINSAGLLDNVYTSGAYLGNNLTIAYDSVTKTYTLTNSDLSDPYCVIGQYVYLEANVDYYVHMTINGSTKSNAIQMFYGIDGNFTESNSVKFGNDQTNIIRVSESGKYLIRLDNDSATVLTVTNFWISPLFTREVTSYYNESPSSSLVMPQTKFYIPSAYTTDSGITYFNAEGISTRIYNISSNTTLSCQWTQEYDGTYIKNEEGLRSIGSTGNYYIVTNINLSSAWTPISTFSGLIDGLNHAISNLSCVKTGITTAENYGFIVTLNGTVKNATFDSATVTAGYSGYSCDKDVAVGCVAAINNGTIYNVKVVSSTIKIESVGSTSGSNTKRHYAIVGGICGYNNGTIESCVVDSTTVYARSHISKGVGYASAGGIAGRLNSGGKIINASVSNYNVQSYVHSTSSSAGRIHSAAGGIAGSWMDGGTISGESLSGNQYILADYDGDAYPRDRYYYGNNGSNWVYGYKGSGLDDVD